ncbi:hypothetical protein AKJ09_07464 [Labilithrix luteola]|uniref:Uncharacterized protein n=1 Tax=Labilithrix luteola TaxID=1391654 RepID=A0A0K1Q4Q0_9BACT|nr:hypothetical protein AKJ09_07464 [Labilithrix luteola]
MKRTIDRPLDLPPEKLRGSYGRRHGDAARLVRIAPAGVRKCDHVPIDGPPGNQWRAEQNATGQRLDVHKATATGESLRKARDLGPKPIMAEDER